MHVAGYHDFIALGNQAGTSCNTTPDYIVHGTFVVLVVLVFLQPVLQLSYQTFSSHFTFITVVLMLLIHISTPQCSQSTNAIVPFCCEYPPTHPDIFIVDVALSWCPCFGHHSVADSGWPHRGLIHTYIPISRRSTHTYSFGNVRFKQINSGSRDGSLLAICQPANVYTVLFFALFNCVKSFMCNIKYILHTLNNACLGIGGWSNSPISYPQFQWLLWCAFNDLARRSLSHSTKRHTWFCCRILWTIEFLFFLYFYFKSHNAHISGVDVSLWLWIYVGMFCFLWWNGCNKCKVLHLTCWSVGPFLYIKGHCWGDM